eukprot:3940339-Rhodomonas_salina.5
MERDGDFVYLALELCSCTLAGHPFFSSRLFCPAAGFGESVRLFMGALLLSTDPGHWYCRHVRTRTRRLGGRAFVSVLMYAVIQRKWRVSR